MRRSGTLVVLPRRAKGVGQDMSTARVVAFVQAGLHNGDWPIGMPPPCRANSLEHALLRRVHAP